MLPSFNFQFTDTHRWNYFSFLHKAVTVTSHLVITFAWATMSNLKFACNIVFQFSKVVISWMILPDRQWLENVPNHWAEQSNYFRW